MSISDRLRELDGKVIRRFEFPSRKPPKRRLYLADQAMIEFDNPNSAVNSLVGRGFVEASLARWVSGGHVNGNKRRGLFVDRLKPPPPDVWELRITEPIVQARGLGFFAEKDTLVLMRLHTRKFMGDRHPTQEDQWDRTMKECVETWNRLFAGHSVHQGTAIYDFVSENVDDFPI